MLQTFNNRDMALSIWAGILVIFLVFKKSTRKTLGLLLKQLFATKLIITFLSATLYVAVSVYLLFKIGLWDMTQLKTTILWLLTAGYVFLFDVTDTKKNNYFREAVKDILKFTLIVEFIAEFYSFNLFIELLLIPFIVLLSGTIAVGGRKAEYKQVVNLLNNALTLLGLAVLGYSVFKIIDNFHHFASKGTLSEFLIPPALTFLYIPFVYVLSLIVNLESSMIMISRELGSKQLIAYAKLQAFLHFPINKNDLFRWSRLILITHPKNKKDLKLSITLLKEMKLAEKIIQDIPIGKGWSPYKSKDFLISEGLLTRYYQPVYGNEWAASSTSLDLNESILASSISYYVEGNRTIANKLTLSLCVYSKTNDKDAHPKFLLFANALVKAALKQPIPKDLETAILKGKEIRKDLANKTVALVRSNWQNHKLNGYNMDFIIQVK